MKGVQIINACLLVMPCTVGGNDLISNRLLFEVVLAADQCCGIVIGGGNCGILFGQTKVECG